MSQAVTPQGGSHSATEEGSRSNTRNPEKMTGPVVVKTKQDRSTWESQYQSGLWGCLQDDHESARYEMVAAFVQRDRHQLSLADVGCGEGVILGYLNLEFVAKYTGIDIAQSALDKIKPRRTQDRYICSSLENYCPDEKWDVVLFNEVLYYTFDPVPHLRKFETSLEPGGCFVISMFKKRSPLAFNNRCIRRVRRYLQTAAYRVEDGVEVSKIDGSGRWLVLRVRPPARSEGA